MPEVGHEQGEVVEFPPFEGRTELLAKLDGFVMSDLAPVIGFERGAYALYQAGYQFVGDLVAASPEVIAKVPGIGAKKLERIETYVKALGLSFGQDIQEWREYRRRFPADDEPSRQHATALRPTRRCAHLKIVSL